MLNEILAKHFYVKNKRLALLSPLFFCWSLETNVHLKRTFLCRNLEFKNIDWKNCGMCVFV